MDREMLEERLESIQAQLAETLPNAPEYAILAAQEQMLQNELEYEPIVPPIFGPHPWGPHGGGGWGPHGGGGGHRR